MFHIVWHPSCTESAAAASHLIQHFTRERFAIEEMDVSVCEWSKPPLGIGGPSVIRLRGGRVSGRVMFRLNQWAEEVLDRAAGEG